MDTTAYPLLKRMSPQFLVADLERSIEFYTKILGFDLDFRYEDFYAGVIKNGCSIHFKWGKVFAKERRSKRNSEGLDIVFSVEGIEELYEELSNKSVEIIQSLRTMPYGREFYIADPDGYVIAFLAEL